MAIIHGFRYPAYAIVLISSAIVLGLDAYVTSLTSPEGYHFVYAALGIAAAVTSLVFIPLFLTLDALRPILVTSTIWFELLWSGILWALWLAAAVDTASLGITSCHFLRFSEEGLRFCRQIQASEAFAFIAWIFLFIYWLWLLVNTIMDQSHHKGIWHTSVRSASFQRIADPEMSKLKSSSATTVVPPPGNDYAAHPAHDSHV